MAIVAGLVSCSLKSASYRTGIKLGEQPKELSESYEGALNMEFNLSKTKPLSTITSV